MDFVSALPALIAAVSFFGESVFGFGGGLVAIPLIGLILGVHKAVTFILIFQLCMGILIFRTHKETDWTVARPMTAGLVAGTVLGTFIFSIVSGKFLVIFLAVFILMFLAKSVFLKEFTLGSGRSALWGSIAGLFGGLFQGLIGTGGPVLTMYLSVATPAKSTLWATIIYLFFVTSIIRVCISAWQGLFTPDLVTLSLATVPFCLVAIILGQVAHTKISDTYYRMAIYVILSLSAVSLLFKAFTNS
jgi:hypothetical protein